jgi:hypothetical protein
MSQTRLGLAALVVACAILHSDVVRAAALSAPSCSQADVQAVIDAAVDGDAITIPAGTCTWTTPVVWSNKSIAVAGAGIGQTIINKGGNFVFYVAMTNTAHAGFRITGMTFAGTVEGNAVINVTSESCTCIPSGWRIDHNRFDYPKGSRAGIAVRGLNYGVIDHNQFNWYQGFATIVSAFVPADTCSDPKWQGNYTMSTPLDIGTSHAVYIEDNVYTSNGNAITAYDTSAGGARAVFRHNTVNGGFYYAHWTRGCEIGGILHEVYANTFIGNAAYGDPAGADYPARIEAGTGVFFNNTVQNFGKSPFIWLDDRRGGGSESNLPLGACDGSHAWDGNLGDSSAPGWPCLGQIGRSPGKSTSAIEGGSKQGSSPFYAWNNGLESTCATGGPCTDVVDVFGEPSAYVKSTPHPNGDVDFVVHSARPGYIPYTYPHPLVSGTQPSPPTNVRIVGQ